MKSKIGRGRRRPSLSRDSEPLKNAIDNCMNCDVMTRALKLGKEKLIGVELGNLRDDCQACASADDDGIRKFDAIYTAGIMHQKFYQNRNIGKKPTNTKNYGQAIKELREEGKTLDEIAKIVGIARSSVQRVIADLKKHEERINAKDKRKTTDTALQQTISK